MDKLNSVGGRVFIKESGLGIPDLVVAVADVDAVVVGSRAAATLVRTPVITNAQPARRLGSALTDRSGRFELRYFDGDIGELRPDLVLTVYAPMGLDSDARQPVTALYSSVIPRVDAGRAEAYSIALPLNLVRAWLPAAELDDKALLARATKGETLAAAMAALTLARVRNGLAARAEARQKSRVAFSGFLLPPFGDARGKRFVEPGDDLKATQENTSPKS